MIYMAERWKITVVLILSLLLTGLAYVGSLRAQIKEDEVDFEVLATITMTKDVNSRLWNLAQEYYGNPLKWTFIKEMNKIPNEKAIPLGTVIYIPIEDAKQIAKKVEEKIEEKKVVEDELSAKIKKMQKDLRSANSKLKACNTKNERLGRSVERKEATINELEGMLDSVKGSLDKIKAESELEAQAREMRAAAQASAERKRVNLDEDLEKQTRELEMKLRQCRSDIERLGKVRDELNAKIRMSEVTKKPTMPVVQKPADRKSMIVAIAIAVVGSIVWIASN